MNERAGRGFPSPGVKTDTNKKEGGDFPPAGVEIA